MGKHTLRPLTVSSAVGAGSAADVESIEGPAPGVSVCQGSGGGDGKD